jgi:hypothetical protein
VNLTPAGVLFYQEPQENMTKFQAYEYLKALWLARNPTCTSEQYEAAMADIARKVGL